MRAYAKRLHGRVYGVEVKQGHQYFSLDYEGNKAECEWLVSMFQKALEHHDKESGSGKSGKVYQNS